MDDLSVGQLVLYANNKNDLRNYDPLDRKVGVIVKLCNEKIYSPYLTDGPINFRLYKVFFSGTVYVVGRGCLTTL